MKAMTKHRSYRELAFLNDYLSAGVTRRRGLTPIGTAVTLWPTSEDK